VERAARTQEARPWTIVLACALLVVTPPGWWLISGTSPFPVFGFAISAGVAYGLWQRAQWGWISALVLAASDIVFGILNLATLPRVGTFQIAVGVAVIGLLVPGPSKDWVRRNGLLSRSKRAP
jgi:hypothetical protein